MDSADRMFSAGDRVVLVVDSSQEGVVLEALPSVGGMGRYRVFHSGGNIGEYYANQIAPYGEEAAAEAGQESLECFLANYAARKLMLPSYSSLFSLNAGKIKFIPYQFRPLKRIVKADRPRLLIADEVGVGKTIETGIIIKEFERREDVESIMIVCPKELTSKWQREMRSRFDEPFAILDGAALDYCIDELELEDEWPYHYGKCIVGLELIRREQTVAKLMSLGDRLHFDMLVLDEAHHVVNTASNSFAIMECLASCSDVAVFLSATPIQLKSRDLYALLSLLLPEEFSDEKAFDEMTKPNAYLNGAIRSIRGSVNDGWQNRAAEQLLQVSSASSWAEARYGRNRQLAYWCNRLSGAPVSDMERIACLRDLEDLQSFSHVINRTKRRDIGEFTLREPVTVEIEYNSSERAFYEAAHEFELAIYSALHGAYTAKMIMATIDRLMTSCLPAFVEVLDGFVTRGLVSVAELSDDMDAEFDNVELGDDLRARAANLRALAERLSARDSKTEQLLRIIDETVSESEDGKLLVFSFFKNTLRYLKRMVALSGARCALITGETDSDERDDLRERFRLPKENPNAIDVLLSSEVGCEGLDYEFCSRMVNYDIPWNPMKIEQRIGRIDRFGQKSPKVRIYNFITNDTVEERIFFRCYERLGIFNSTVGDLESVLGSVESDLTKLAFDLELTDEQKREKAQQKIDNAIRDVAEQREFETNSKELFLMDLSMEDEAVGRERDVQMLLLQRLLMRFFMEACPSSKCDVAGSSQLRLRLYRSDKDTLLKLLVRLKRGKKVEVASKQYWELESFLQDDTQVMLLDFDGSNETGSNAVLFVSLGSPLVTMALEEIQPPALQNINLRVQPGVLPEGYYSFACCEWEQKGYRKTVDIETVIVNSETGMPVEISLVDFENILLMGVEGTNACEFNGSAIDELVYAKQTAEKERLLDLNNDVVTSKIAILEESYGAKITRLREQLNLVKDEKIKRMRTRQINNLQAVLDQRREEYEARRVADIIVRRFASGTIEVC